MRRSAGHIAWLALAAGLGLAAAFPATAQTAGPDPATFDPWEKPNRAVYRANKAVDHAVFAPLAHGYMALVPRYVRGGIHNILLNLDEPTIFVNRMLQLRFGRAGKTAVRFATNSTLGLGGAFDLADRGGLPRDPTDFGQTLAKYGAGQGPYLFVPFLGPSTVRDSFGKTVDLMTSPLNWTPVNRYPPSLYTRLTFWTLDARSQADPVLKEVEATATDPYATLRSLYLQNRQSLIRAQDGDAAIDLESLPDYGPEPATPAGDELRSQAPAPN